MAACRSVCVNQVPRVIVISHEIVEHFYTMQRDSKQLFGDYSIICKNEQVIIRLALTLLLCRGFIVLIVEDHLIVTLLLLLVLVLRVFLFLLLLNAVQADHYSHLVPGLSLAAGLFLSNIFESPVNHV